MSEGRVTIDVDAGKVCWTIRDEKGELVAQSRMDPPQALRFGSELVERAVKEGAGS